MTAAEAATMTDEELRDALDGLFAYDVGCVDFGIHDERLRQRCIAALRAGGGRVWLTRLVRDMWMSEEAIERGYGIEDALEFSRWLSDWMKVDL